MHKYLFAFIAALSMTGLAGDGISQHQPQNPGTRVITLGTRAGSVPGAHRAQSSNLLIVNGVCCVVDAGDGVARRLAKGMVNMREIGTIFITHHHDDLGLLLSRRWHLLHLHEFQFEVGNLTPHPHCQPHALVGSRWCTWHSGIVNSSETLRPSARG